MEAGIPAYIEHQEAFLAFDAALRRFRSDQVEEWEQRLAEWEEDPTKPCPYQSSRSGLSSPDPLGQFGTDWID